MKESISPLEEIQIESTSKKGIRLFIKRDDLLHPEISGNKWRKLKYNIEKARSLKKDTLLTFGGAFSNHIAATAAAGSEFGFKTIGVIRGEEHLPLNPTLKLAKENGMQFHYVSRSAYREKEEKCFIDNLRSLFGEFYLVPEGGSNYLAVNGCMEIVSEVDEDFDYVCCACGTGATLAGITLSLKEHQKALGFPALKGGEFLEQEVKHFIRGFFFDQETNEDFYSRFQIVPDYHFGGYAKTRPELIDFLREFYKQTKIKLDPVYTGKMAYGVMDLIEKDFFPEGSRILLIHSGGLQGIEGIEEKLKGRIFPEE